jgi:hypothetical protein
MNKNDFFSVCKKKMLIILSIAYFSLLAIFCKIGYMFFPSQVRIFFLGRIANFCSVWCAQVAQVNEVQSNFHPKFALKSTLVFFSEKHDSRVWTNQEYLGQRRLHPFQEVVIYLKLVCGANAHQPVWFILTLHT